MQTIYLTTNKFVRRSGNVVDFTDYLRRMEELEQKSLRESPAPVRSRSGQRRSRRPSSARFPLGWVVNAAIFLTSVAFALCLFTL